MHKQQEEMDVCHLFGTTVSTDILHTSYLPSTEVVLLPLVLQRLHTKLDKSA